jgi:hypothetical protein
VEGREKIEISGNERRNNHRNRDHGYDTTKDKNQENSGT